MKRALLRADGSERLGMGHIMRSIGLAQGFEKNEIEPLFLTRGISEDAVNTIKDYGFEVKTAPEELPLENDLKFTKKAAQDFGAEIIVTDLCTSDILEQVENYENYLKELGNSEFFTLTIDDLNKSIKFYSDILVNPNYGAKKEDYVSQPPDTELLLGLKYFIFRDEFIEASQVEKEIKERANDLLVTLGGSDQLSLNEKVAEALNIIENSENMTVRFVIGIDSKVEERLASILSSFEGKVEFLNNCSSMADQMLWSDVAITGGGLTKYETAVTGTPSIVIAQSEHQDSLLSNSEMKDCWNYLGYGSYVTKNEIADEVHKLLANHTIRANMYHNLRELVDGLGRHRIIKQIL